MSSRKCRAAALLGIFFFFGIGLGEIIPQARESEWTHKVDPWVMKTSENGSETEFIVWMTVQADLGAAARMSSKERKGFYVYQELTSLAAQTQAPLLADLKALGLKHQPFWIANMIRVRGNRKAVETLIRRADVARICANPEVPMDRRPISVFSSGSTEPNLPATIEWGVSKVRAPDLWTLGFRGEGVVIGGQDTGYDWDHPAIVNQYRGWNGSAADHNYNWHDAIHGGADGDLAEPYDDHNHGTHTMGTILGNDLAPADPNWPAGATNPIGVAPGARWICCRNMKLGVGTPTTYAECYQWFLAPTDLNNLNPNPALAPDVINNSWGCPASEGCTDPNVLLTVVRNVRAAGILTVHSAGNAGPSCGTVGDPAAIYDESFSVGATNALDTIASFSSRGPVTADGSGRMKPDISAPGVNVRSAIPNGNYALMSGTSMAGPHVAGVAALLLSAKPELTGDVDGLEDALTRSAVPLTTSQGCGGDSASAVPNNVYGWGRIDAYAAYQQGSPAPALTVTSPNGGENWDAGGTSDIIWTTSGTVGNVKLEYSTDGGTAWTTIVASTPSVVTEAGSVRGEFHGPTSNSYAWVLPAVASANCVVRVSEVTPGSLSDTSDAVFTINKDKPIIGLSKRTFNFAAVRKGRTTPPDSVLIMNPGGGIMKWTAASSAAWLVISPKTGPANKTLKIKVVKAGALAVGTYTASITVTDPNATNSPATIYVTLVVKAEGTDALPFGSFDTPADGANINTATVTVAGWALDDIGMKSAKIYRKVSETKKSLVGIAKFIAGARPDIEAAHPTYPQNNRAGWYYTLKMSNLPNKGVGAFVLMAYVQDLSGHLVLLGTHTITGVAPTGSAAVPFGDLDLPEDGGTASGTAYNVTGWALTPPPNKIAAAGLALWVDGLAVGNPAYGSFREDIAAEYSGHGNADRPGGSFVIDTMKFQDGWHTIAWSAADSGGAIGEIGSRYFRAKNETDSGLNEAEAIEEGASPVIGNPQYAARPVSEIASIPEDGRTPVYLKSGFMDEQAAETIYPDADGSIRIKMPQVSRLAIYLNREQSFENEAERLARTERVLRPRAGRFEAYALVGEELRALPIGAAFDSRDGILFWQPGPGFLGEHRFVIIDSVSMTRKMITISISGN